MVDGVRNVFRLMVMHIADKNTNAVGDIQRFTQTNAISYLFSKSAYPVQWTHVCLPIDYIMQRDHGCHTQTTHVNISP